MDKINTRKLTRIGSISHVIDVADRRRALYCKRWGIRPAAYFLKIKSETLDDIMNEGLYEYDKDKLSRSSFWHRLFGRRGSNGHV